MFRPPSPQWIWKGFFELTPRELYAVLGLRQAVFVVEQNCPYLDLDGLDLSAEHLMGWQDETLLAYLRLLPAQVTRSGLPSLGRVVTAQSARQQGLGRTLMKLGIQRIQREFPETSVQIEAQLYLERFYSGLGFQRISENYLEDGILHLSMLLPARTFAAGELDPR